MSGDREARFRAEELCEVQQAGGSVLLEHLADHGNALAAAMHAATEAEQATHSWLDGIFGAKTEPAGDHADSGPDADQRRLELEQEMSEVQEQLDRLAGSRI